MFYPIEGDFKVTQVLICKIGSKIKILLFSGMRVTRKSSPGRPQIFLSNLNEFFK